MEFNLQISMEVDLQVFMEFYLQCACLYGI